MSTFVDVGGYESRLDLRETWVTAAAVPGLERMQGRAHPANAYATQSLQSLVVLPGGSCPDVGAIVGAVEYRFGTGQTLRLFRPGQDAGVHATSIWEICCGVSQHRTLWESSDHDRPAAPGGRWTLGTGERTYYFSSGS